MKSIKEWRYIKILPGHKHWNILMKTIRHMDNIDGDKKNIVINEKPKQVTYKIIRDYIDGDVSTYETFIKIS